jgi:hypothetical protein
MIDTTAGLSRRRFLAQASYFGAFYAFAKAIPLQAMSASLSDDHVSRQRPWSTPGLPRCARSVEARMPRFRTPPRALPPCAMAASWSEKMRHF